MNKYLQKLETNKKKLEKLNTELSKKLQKVQLGIVDDIDRAVTSGTGFLDDAKVTADELQDALADYNDASRAVMIANETARDIQDELSQTETELMDLMQELENSADDLGIDVNDIPALKTAEGFIDELVDVSEQLEESMNDIPRGLL